MTGTNLKKEQILVTVNFSTYIDIINYFHRENNQLDKYRLIASEITGNKVWKDTDNQVVAKHIINFIDEDDYTISQNVLDMYNRKV